MEESRTHAAPGAPLPAPAGAGRWTGGEQPSERACPRVELTPVPGFPPPGQRPGAVHVAVSGIAVLAITAELGRRSGAPARLTALCSAAGVAAVVGPRLVSAVPRPRLRTASTA